MVASHEGTSGGAGGGDGGQNPQPQLSGQRCRMRAPYVASLHHGGSCAHEALAPFVNWKPVNDMSQNKRLLHAPHDTGHLFAMSHPLVAPASLRHPSLWAASSGHDRMLPSVSAYAPSEVTMASTVISDGQIPALCGALRCGSSSSSIDRHGRRIWVARLSAFAGRATCVLDEPFSVLSQPSQVPSFGSYSCLVVACKRRRCSPFFHSYTSGLFRRLTAWAPTTLPYARTRTLRPACIQYTQITQRYTEAARYMYKVGCLQRTSRTANAHDRNI